MMAVLVIPSVGMIFHPTTVSYENRELKELPKVRMTDGSFNMRYFDDVSDYVSDHIALRNETAALYSLMNAGMFSVSARQNVILGEDDWLYYTATTDDYLHKDPASDRMLFAAAHNMALIQEYCELLGKKAVFAIAPNKNTLYGEHMPKAYRDARERSETKQSDLERLVPFLVSEGVNFADLKGLFEAQNETLYYKKDSHWNNKGALLVYRQLMQQAGAGAADFDGDSPEISVDFTGDLNKMLYGMAARPEEKLNYIKDITYFYCVDGGAQRLPDSEMVEKNEVETVNPEGKGNLLMYRDSYANSLIPYLSRTFSYAYYTKTVPYNMTDLVVRQPDYVIFEKAERHLPTFAQVPPIMSAPLRVIEGKTEKAEFLLGPVRVSDDGVFCTVSGRLKDTDIIKNDSRIYISADPDEGPAYEAFLTETETEGSGFTCYIPVSALPAPESVFTVILGSEGSYFEESQEEAF